MLSEARQTARSPTSSSRTESNRAGPYSATAERQSRRSSISEENDNEYEQATDERTNEQTDGVRTPPRREDQYISALQHRFPSRPKSDYAYSRPIGATTIPPAPPLTGSGSRTAVTPPTPASSGSRSTPRPTNGGASTTRTDDDRTTQKPALRRVNPEDQNAYARRTVGNETTPGSNGGGARRTTPSNVRGNAREVDDHIPSTSFTTQTRTGRPGESIFEKVDAHGGPVSYLGTGTFSQFEHCLRECLARERHHTGYDSHLIRHDLPARSSARVSLLDDLSYDPVASSHHHHQPYHLSHSYGGHDYSDAHRRSAALLSLDDIRHVNEALAKSGIHVFSHHGHQYHDHHHQQHHDDGHHYHDQHHHHQQPHNAISSWFGNMPPPHHGGRRIIGEIVSACRIVDEDPGNRSHGDAIQHVWNAAQHYQPFGHQGGYASPAVQGVVSHLFNPQHQTPYDPVHGVASHLFSGQPSQRPPSVPPSYGSPYPYPHPPPPQPPPPPPMNSFYAH